MFSPQLVRSIANIKCNMHDTTSLIETYGGTWRAHGHHKIMIACHKAARLH